MRFKAKHFHHLTLFDPSISTTHSPSLTLALYPQTKHCFSGYFVNDAHNFQMNFFLFLLYYASFDCVHTANAFHSVGKFHANENRNTECNLARWQGIEQMIFRVFSFSFSNSKYLLNLQGLSPASELRAEINLYSPICGQNISVFGSGCLQNTNLSAISKNGRIQINFPHRQSISRYTIFDSMFSSLVRFEERMEISMFKNVFYCTICFAFDKLSYWIYENSIIASYSSCH